MMQIAWTWILSVGIHWWITWALLVAILAVSVVRTTRIRYAAQRDLDAFEKRLRESAKVKQSMQIPIAERVAEIRRQRAEHG